MTWRKWLVRGLVFTVLALGTGFGAVYALWTSPEAVRRVVQEQLGIRLVRVGVQVGSARLRLLGGILVHELRLFRTEGLDRSDFLYVPAAIIFHDKERLLDGRVAVRKIELDGPQIHLVRDRDGRLNISGLAGPADPSERVPFVVIRNGKVTFDCRQAGGGSMLEVRDVEMTVVNDPLPVLTVSGTGNIDLLGPVSFRLVVPRAGGGGSLDLKLSAFPVGKELVERVCRYAPNLRPHLDAVSGVGSLAAKVELPTTDFPSGRYELTLAVKKGEFAHPTLPHPLAGISLTATVADGVLTVLDASAGLGRGRVAVHAEGVNLARIRPTPADMDAATRLLRVTARDLDVTDAFVRLLPPHLKNLEDDYAPRGPVDVAFTYRRGDVLPTVREWVVEPKGMTGTYRYFPYPLADVRGRITIDASNLDHRRGDVHLTAAAGDTRARLDGTAQGDKFTGGIDLELQADGLLLDEKVRKALPEKVAAVAAGFYCAESRKKGLDACPLGRADVRVKLSRAQGRTALDKTFTIRFKDAHVLYDQFPYELTGVSGELRVFGDRWEAAGFRGRHGGGELFVDGELVRRPTLPDLVRVKLRGVGLVLDDDFERALVPLNGADRRSLLHTWRSLRPGGKLHFVAEVSDTPAVPQNIEVKAGVAGVKIRPRFFDYEIADLSGRVEYSQGNVKIAEVKGSHGATAIEMASGLIRTGSEGGFTAWLRGLTAKDLRADADLLRAVPEAVRSTLEGFKLRSPADVGMNLTINAPPGVGATETWWEGAIGLNRARLHLGVEAADATGEFYCKGFHDGRRLRGVSGKVQFSRVSLLNQPLTNVRATVEAEPRSPDVVRIRDLSGDVFGGKVVGQARLDIAGSIKYDVNLEALGIDLTAFGRHNLGETAKSAQLEGPARAAIHLVGEGGDLLGLKGNGRIDVTDGKMGRLPVLIDMFKTLGLRAPDGTAFEQCEAVFAIEGPRVRVQKLELLGNAVSLTGEGGVDLDGSNVKLDFNATLGRLAQIMPGPDFWPRFSGQFFKLTLRGGIGRGNKLTFDRELIPGVTSPLKRLFGQEP